MLADFFSDLVWTLGVLGFIFGLYFLPAIVAFAREVPSKWSIGVINLFLGWTLVGWVVALAMAVRSVPPSPAMLAHAAPTTSTRACSNCGGAMLRSDRVCPHCAAESTPWILHAGVWWSRGKSDEWQWVDDEAHIWRWYKDGTPSDPAAVDKTANLRIDPAVVRPPDRASIDPAAPQSQELASFAGELERLADLHARGALTDDQFEAAKVRLLES